MFLAEGHSAYPLGLWDNSLMSSNYVACSLPFYAIAGFRLIQQKIHEGLDINMLVKSVQFEQSSSKAEADLTKMQLAKSAVLYS